MTFKTLQFAEEEVAKLKAENRFLAPRVVQSAQKPVSIIDGKEVINLGSYNYLGMYGNPETMQAAIDAIKKETRHFAKRQLTWFRKEKEAVFIDKTEFGSDDEIVERMLKDLPLSS